jgi:cell division protein FtsB
VTDESSYARGQRLDQEQHERQFALDQQAKRIEELEGEVAQRDRLISLLRQEARDQEAFIAKQARADAGEQS